MNLFAVAILGYVTLERLAELLFARSNTRRLLAKGAAEHSAGHYPLIVAVHALWLIALWMLATGRTPDLFWLAMYVLLQAARFWVLATLGGRWTTRIITLPGEDLVRKVRTASSTTPITGSSRARSRCFRSSSASRGWR